MRTTDYNGGIALDEMEKEEGETYSVEDLRRLAGINLRTIKDSPEYPNLLVFPGKWNAYHDRVVSSVIFTLSDKNELKTRNIMGFIGVGNTNLAITSRFAEKDKSDNFLYYMLYKVMKINIFNLKHPEGKNGIWDFLLFLFPIFLNKALSQGLYKEYKYNEYNDANVRGVIDVKRHIRLNIPFSGKVAYSTREYSYDNPVTQIIRHTIEYIKAHEWGGNLLTADSVTHMNTGQIMFSTPTYNRNSRQKIIGINRMKTVVHPYFREYRELQNLCIRILCNEKLSYRNEKEKVHGILFNGSWLWEEYLNMLLKRNFEYQRGCRLFENSNETIRPDFIGKRKPRIICDAKYKPLDELLGRTDRKRNLADYYQLITYMYRLKSKKGFLLFPYSDEKWKNPEIKKLKLGGEINLLGLKIPNHTDFREFLKAMEESEKKLIDEIEKQ